LSSSRTDASERLSKFLSQNGIASRRKSDAIIKSGRVKVNNVKVLEPFYRVNTEEDVVTIDNYVINKSKSLIYIALYKPIHYLSDLSSIKTRNLARKLIPIKSYLFPIGRLDYNSEGLMLFSNDGNLANKIMHPRYGVEKEYLVKFKGVLNESIMHQITDGVNIERSIYRVSSIKFLKLSLSNSWYRVILKEGKNRMIRKIGNKIKHPVLKLVRLRIGPIKLGTLKPGEYRFLSDREKSGLLKISQLGCSSDNLSTP
jgi:23S rRNA pseudouridine2605 synthase